jgi:putative transport protein
MEASFRFLAGNPFILLFLVVGVAVALGRVTVRGHGVGMVAPAIVVGIGIAALASTYGVTLRMDDFTKSLFYALLMYGVGLQVGPSLMNSLDEDEVRFAALAVLCSFLGLVLAAGLARLFDLPPGAAAGILAGAMTIPAAIGSAEQAVTSRVVALPQSVSVEQVSSMIALSYGVTYIYGTAGILLLGKYLPKWWGVDVGVAARAVEDHLGVRHLDEAGLSGYRPGGIRAYRVTNPETAGTTIAQFRSRYPMYRVVNVVQGNTALAVDADVVLERGTVVALGGRLEDLPERIGLVGPEVADQRALNVPLDHAEVLVTNHEVFGRPLRDFRNEEFSGEVTLVKMERGGQPFPMGPDTTVRRMDVLHFAGIRSAVCKAGAFFGRMARANSSTDLLTLAIGMILGLLIGKVTLQVWGAALGLGNAGGLLVSGVIVSLLLSRLRFLGDTPKAARNFLHDLGLIVFAAIVAINAGAALVNLLSGPMLLYIFVAGFIVCTVPPVVAWAVGFHLFKINAAVLAGSIGGARAHAGPARHASLETGSAVPWIGFPVSYAVSSVLLTAFGYVSMVLP